MPELPEVEVSRLGIRPHILDKKVNAVILRRPDLRWPIPDEIQDQLPGNCISEVSRLGKYLLLESRQGDAIIHLGMSGSLRILPPDSPAEKHDHVDIVFNNCLLRLNDPRRFGAVLWQAQNETHPLLSKLGLEPLSAEFSGERLYMSARNKTVPIKSLIMNSHIIVGVGNIYAAEALFQAGIHPLRPAAKISRKRMQLLADAIKNVLQSAIKAGGTTLKDFTRSDGKPGYFRHELQVYNRGGKACFTCGKELKMMVIQSRSTVYCSFCQR
jgi:formamidopyrimidine-DNA glycosylase